MLSLARSAIGRAASGIASVATGPALAMPFLACLHKGVCMDGNTAAATVAYGMSELHTIFPITPASTMGEVVDDYNTKKKKNMFGKVTTVTEMESEMGVAGSVHGATMAGGLVSTFTSSQGLLLMIPNFIRLAGGLYPAVVHVAARCVAGHSLAIYPDHGDVMAARATGIAMLASNSVQEVMDLGVVSHMASIRASYPILHFFDGFKTSHEVNTIHPISYETMNKLFDHDAHKAFRNRTMNTSNPDVRGTIMTNEPMWQIIEAADPHINKIADIIEDCMDKLAVETGRHYKPYDYYGAPDADRVVIIMGSGAHPVKEMIDYLNKKGEKVGVLMVRMYRPFSAERFLKTLPKSVKRIAVLDRTREPLATGDPLFLDFKSCMPTGSAVEIYGGRYGISGKEFNPMMAKAVFDNLKAEKPKNGFLVGITDDVTNRSLPIESAPIDTVPEGSTQCLFWGIGSDGTVGANKQAIKIIGTQTENFYGQGNFVYSAHKSGGITVSHLRFGPKPQLSSYNITQADYVAVHCFPYLHKFTQILDPIKVGGTFVVNAPYETMEELEKNLPNFVKRTIARRNIKFYSVNATALADKLGLHGKINMIMQSAFFKLSKVLPDAQAVQLLKDAVKKEYGRKGEAIVKSNWDAIDNAAAAITEVKYPASWADLPDDKPQYLAVPKDASEFAKNIFFPVTRMQGDDLPVSTWVKGNDVRGNIPPSMAAYDKRAFATSISQWANNEDCSQCNMCSALCPHAAIRPFMFSAQEAKAAGLSSDFKFVKAKGAKAKGLNFSIQVSGSDCTGCGVCVSGCPDSVLELIPIEECRAKADEHFQQALKLPAHTECFDVETLKGSQFVPPYIEFNGACAGCAEPAILKLISQLYGDEMYVANQAGCTCVWMSNYPVNPFTVDKNGHGPAYGQGLFEDGAEFGFGMHLAVAARRDNLKTDVEALLKNAPADMTPRMKELLEKWVKNYKDRAQSRDLAREIKAELKNIKKESALNVVKKEESMLAKKNQWLVGGDGWAYDINFQGLDHVMAQGQDVKILVLDNEVYANTGGQSSKSTPRSSIAKFAMGGKKTPKKDLGAMMMTYGNVYVASTCFDADPQQALKAIKEAESYDGPAIIINYAPCINHGITGGLGNAVVQSKKAVDEGYVHLYRYNPMLAKEGKNPMVLDSKPKTGLDEMLKTEVRYNSLHLNIPAEEAKAAHQNLAEDLVARYKRYQKLAQ